MGDHTDNRHRKINQPILKLLRFHVLPNQKSKILNRQSSIKPKPRPIAQAATARAEHAHCIPQAEGALLQFADEHDGRFPYSTNGWGDALMMLTPERSWFYFINGPGYANSAFEEALASGGNVDEKRCGRVYVQGLSITNDPKIAILFDRVTAPPDHCHFPRRLSAGFVREVCFVDGDWRMVPVAEWPEFAGQQVELLIAAGFSRAQAQQLYDEVR